MGRRKEERTIDGIGEPVGGEEEGSVEG